MYRVPSTVRLAVTCLFVFVVGSNAFAAGQVSELLWPSGAPDNLIAHDSTESVINRTVGQNEMGLNRSISFVSVPELTVFPAPDGKATGAAVVIFPGGGFTHLAIDKEGYDIARWLNTIGITGIVVKYRTKTVSAEEDRHRPGRQIGAIISDGRRSVRLARHNAAKWNIDPDRIGVIGFSAGGYLAASVAAGFDSGDNAAEDPVQKMSSRPDFAGLIYPAMPPDFEALVRGDTPPLFFVNAADDRVTPAEKCIMMFEAARAAGARTEMHVFDNGGHGFGMGVMGGAVARWPELFTDWLVEIGVTKGK